MKSRLTFRLGMILGLATTSVLVACGDDESEDSMPQGGAAGAKPQAGAPSTSGSGAGGNGSGAGGGQGNGSGAGGIDGGAAGFAGNGEGGLPPFDPQVPPNDASRMEAWLDEELYEEWACEPEPTKKTDGASAIHVHGAATRVCSNILLATASRDDGAEFPAGAASVKEIYDDDGMLTDRVVSVKVNADSDSGEGWFWYGSPNESGLGLATCTGCHGVAGSDADHPGAGDYVYFKVRDEAELPPIDGAAMQDWLDAGHYLDWECERAANTKTDGAAAIHVHGKTRVCTNARLAAASKGSKFPAGSASVKEVYSGDRIASYDIYLKVFSDTAGGDGWFWYAGGANLSGFGLSDCIGCHGAAGSDADHPGAGDFVYFKN